MQKSFSFKGINHSADTVLAQDGECLDVINMRMSNGSLLPMPQPRMLNLLNTSFSACFWHTLAECYVAITADDEKSTIFYDKNFERISTDVIVNNVQSVEFIGNVACCLTSNGIHYLLFENGGYRALGERPEIPDCSITLTSRVESVVTEYTYYSSVTDKTLEASWKYNEKGYIEECISALNKAGFYVDRALFRVALRLYDGSYVNVSNIMYASDEVENNDTGRDGRNMVSETVDSNNPTKYRVSVRGFKPKFTFDTSALDAWRSIVVGIDVFSTASITGKRSEIAGRTQKFEMYTEKSLDALWEDVASASLFYKVAEFDIDGKLIFRLEDVSSASLALQQGLETEVVPSSLSSYGVKSSIVYNSRLHIAAIKEYFFKGHNVEAYLPVNVERNKADAMLVQIRLRTTQGDFVAERHYDNPPLCHDGYNYVLPAMLTYPDARACEIGIYIKKGQTVYGKVLPLTAHRYLNVAYYLHKWYSPYSVTVTAVFSNGGSPAASISAVDALRVFDEVGTYEIVYSASKNSWMYRNAAFPPSEFSSMKIFAIHRGAADGDKLIFTIKRGGVTDFSFQDINNIVVDGTWTVMDELPVSASCPYEERANVMKVSMVDNPFVFPAKCTYTPSQNDIVGLSSNTVALSQGQFGQFPLYIFCTDAIWAMSVDSTGSLAYMNCNLVSRDVCINKNSICGIGGGVVFAGKQGMMLIAGNSVKKFSGAIDGNALAPVSVPGDMLAKISSLVGLNFNKANDDFQNFISKAYVAYLPSHNEVLISNQSRPYSFVYSFASGVWSRYYTKFHNEIKGTTTPHFIAQMSGGTGFFTIPDEMSGDNRVLLVTRPLIWGTKLPKRIMQLMLHACAEHPWLPTTGMPLLACYMLASNDGVHFKLIAGCEKNRSVQDVLFPYFPTQSYKYYIFALVGDMGEGSVITAVEVDVNVPWRNRLR